MRGTETEIKILSILNGTGYFGVLMNQVNFNNTFKVIRLIA